MKKNSEQPAVKRVGRPKRQDKDHATAPSSEKGTAPGFKRKSYLVSIEISDKIDRIAYWDRKTIKEVLLEAMSDYVKKYEKKNGEVKNI